MGDSPLPVSGAGGGGVNTRVLPNEFLLKSVVFKLISKETSRAEHFGIISSHFRDSNAYDAD